MSDWTGRILDAKDRGGFSVYDESDAGEWDSCAVGEALLAEGVDVDAHLLLSSRAVAIKGEKPSVDLARRLKALGILFTRAVNRDDFEQALWLVDLIENQAGLVAEALEKEAS